MFFELIFLIVYKINIINYWLIYLWTTCFTFITLLLKALLMERGGRHRHWSDFIWHGVELTLSSFDVFWIQIMARSALFRIDFIFGISWLKMINIELSLIRL